MFEALSDRLESAWKKLRGQDKISHSNIQEALREVRRALLEADVNFQVVKDFIAEVEAKAEGAEVIAGVRPDQQFIKIVYDELVRVMGETNIPLAQADTSPTIVLMAGLQGTGKPLLRQNWLCTYKSRIVAVSSWQRTYIVQQLSIS